MMNDHQPFTMMTSIETGAGSEDQIPPLRTQMCAQSQQVAFTNQDQHQQNQ